jgi:predicted phosphodiesterase
MLNYWQKGNSMSLAHYLPVWQEDRSYEGGFLAAAFDGEGCLCHSGKHADGQIFGYQLSYNRKDNPMLASVRTYLAKFGFDFSESIDAEEKHSLIIRGGFQEICRFLGTFRPPRLLAKWSTMDISRKFLECKSDQVIAVTGVEDGGEHEIASMSTSSGTYISQGYGSHNSYEWMIYCHIEQYFRDDPSVSVYVPNEVDAHFSIFGHRFMATHGDTLGVKGGDGLIGALGPIARGAMKIGAQQRQIGRDFDTLVIGHFHFYLPRGDATPVLLSPSLMGHNTYAHLQLRVRASEPAQALAFIHHKYGFTAQWPMLLGKHKARPSLPWFVWGGGRTARDLGLSE